MTSHTGRLYAVVLALVVFFGVWAAVATRPWATSSSDARLKELAAREAQLRKEAALVQEVVAQRWAAYRAELKARGAANAAGAQPAQSASSAPAPASPPVKVVTLPPLTVTRTS